MELEIRESKERDVVVLEIEGRIDDRNGRAIERKVAASLEAGARAFVIDVRRVDVPTGGGVRILLTMARRIDQHEGKLVLCGLGDQFRAVLNVAGFAQFFRTADTKRDAVAEVHGRPVVRGPKGSLSSLVHRILLPTGARTSQPPQPPRGARESPLAALVAELILR